MGFDGESAYRMRATRHFGRPQHHSGSSGTDSFAGAALAELAPPPQSPPFSQVSWKNNVNGVWSNAANWTGGALPNATNDVLLNTLSARTITHNSGNDTIHSITAGKDTLSVTGGTLTVLTTAVFGAGLSVGNAELAIDGTSASVAGTFNDTEGYIVLSPTTTLSATGPSILGTYGYAGNTEIDGGAFATSGTTSVLDYGNQAIEAYFGGGILWTNSGTVNDGGVIGAGDGGGVTASFLNAAGAVFNFTSDDGGIYYGLGSASATFSNAGTLEKTAGGGTSYVDPVVTTTGLVNAATGTIQFDSGGVFGGTITGAGQVAFSGGTATLTAGGNFNVANWLVAGGIVQMATALAYAGSLTITGGDLLLDGTTDSVTGTFIQAGSGSLGLNGSQLSLNNAYLGTGYLEGAGTLTATGTTTLGAGGDYWLGGNATLINSGTINQNYDLYVDYNSGAGFNIVNQAGASWLVNGGGGIADNYGQPVSTFSNAGTFTDTTANEIYVYSVFNNTGVINDGTGTIAFENGGVFSGTLTGSGLIAFEGGVATLTAGASFSAAHLLLDGGSLSLSASETPADASFTLNGGDLLLNGYTLTLADGSLASGRIDGAGTMLTSGATAVATQGDLSIGNDLAWLNSGTVSQGGNLYVENSAPTSFDLNNKAGASYNITGDYYFAYPYNVAPATLENTGTFAKTGGTGTTNVWAYVTNTGTIAANTGTLAFENGGLFGGVLNGAGTIDFDAGIATLTAGAALSTKAVQVTGGSLEIAAGATFTPIGLYAANGVLTFDENVTFGAGALNDAYGNVYLQGNTLTASGATLGGEIYGAGTLATSGATSLDGNSLALTGGVVWVNTGTVTQSGYLYDDYTVPNGYTINNQSGATFNVAGDYYLGYYNGNNNTTATFNNAGTFAKTSGTGATTIYGAFNSTGTVSVNKNGTINFTGGGNFTGSITGTGTVDFTGAAYYTVGGIVGAANTSIGMYQGYEVTLTANTSFAGSFQMYSDTIGLGGYTLTLTGGKSFGVNGYGGEYFQGPGTLSTAGVTTVNDWYNGFIAVDVYDGATWNNTGTVSDGDRIQLGDDVGSGTINNAAGATFGLASDDAWIVQGSYVNGFGQTVPLGATILNAGIFGKTGGTGTSHVYGTLVSTGTVTSATGTLELDNGGALSGLIADKSNVVLANGVNFSIGNLTIGGGATLNNSVTVDATGSLTLGDATSSAKGAWLNNGIYELDGNVGIASGSSAANLFTNTGLLEKISGSGRGVVSANVSDTGTIWANSGTLALTGTVTGAGKLFIGAGDTLELGANVAATQSVTFTAATGTLMLDTVSGAHGTITGFTVGDQIDLVNTSANSATLTGNTLVVYNGATAVATLSLTGTHSGDTYSFLSDGHGGTLLGISANATSWKGTNNDWNAANVWTNGAPSAQSNATVNASGKYTMTLAPGETGTANSLTLNGATATYNLNGQVNITKSLIMQAGTLNLGGVINGGTFTEAGGTVNFTSAGLENLVFQGAVAINGANQYVELLNAVTLTGANGSGGGTVAVTGSAAVLYVDGITTLDNTNISLGSSGSAATLQSYDADGNGGVLTLGTNLVLTQTGLNAALTDSGGPYDAILNNGTIAASFSNGNFLVSGSDFENDGILTVTNGDTLDLESASIVNTGTLTANSATFTLGGSDFLNAGSIAITNSRLNIAGTHTTAQALSLFGTGDTLGILGTLTNTGTTLNIGAGTTLGTILLFGTIEGGTIVDNGNGLQTSEANYGRLSDVTYQGTLNVTGGLNISGSFAATGLGGTGAGSIVDTGNQTEIVFNGNRTLDNVAVGLGNSGGSYLTVNDISGNGATLTLGAHATITQAGSLAYLYYDQSNDAIVNAGSILAGIAGGTFSALNGASASFTNLGSIVVSNGDQFALNNAGNFTNLSGGTLTGGSYEADAGSLFELGNNLFVSSDAATITLSGAGSQIQAYNTNTGHQILIDTKLSSIAVSGVLNLLNGRNFTPTANGGAFTDAGLLNLGGVTFGGTTLTLAGGTLSGYGTVTAMVVDSGRIAATGGILQFAGAVTGSGSVTASSGATVDLTKGGALSQAISGAGTLQLDGATAYALAAGSVTSIASLVVDAGATLSGAGTVTSILAGSGTLATVSGATLDVAGGGSFSGVVNGAGTLQLDGANSFVLLAAGSLGAAQVVIDAASTLDLNAGGAIGGTLSGTGTLQLDGATPYTLGGLSLAIGTVLIDTGAGLSGSGTIAGAVVDAGNFGASTGTLRVGGAISGTGSLFAAGGAVLDLQGGGALATQISGAGTLQLDNASYTLGGGAVGVGTVLLDAGATLSGVGTLTGSITNAGTLAANGGLLKITGNITGAGALAANAGSVLNLTIGASLTQSISGAGTLQLDGGAYSLGGATDSIDAILLDAGASLTGFGTISGSMADNGAITASGGTMALGALTGSGALSAVAGAVLDLTGGGSVTGISGAGALRLDGATAYSLAGSLGIASVSVSAGAGLSGNGTLSGSLADAGTVTASGGTLALNGALSGSGVLGAGTGAVLNLTAGGTLNGVSGAGTLKLDGTTPFSLAGGTVSTASLLVDKNVTLAGTGLVSSVLTNSGTVAASPGTLVLSGSISGTGVLQAGAGAVLDLTAGGALGELVSGAGTLEFGGAYTLGSKLPSVANLAIDATATLSGTGKLVGAVTDTGKLTATSGTLNLAGGLSGGGTLSASAGAVLDITKAGSVFAGTLSGAGTVQIDASTTLNAGATLAVSNFISTANITLGTGESITNGAGRSFAMNAASGGTITLGGAAGDKLTNAGTFSSAGAGTERLTLAVVNSANMGVTAGSLAFVGAVTNNGTIADTAGSETFSKSIGGTGTLAIGAAGTLSLLAGAASGQTAAFLTTTGLLDLTTPLQFLGTIAGFGSSDAIDLISTAANGFSYSGNILTVTNNGVTVANLHFAGSYSQGDFALVSDNNGGTLINFV